MPQLLVSHRGVGGLQGGHKGLGRSSKTPTQDHKVGALGQYYEAGRGLVPSTAFLIVGGLYSVTALRKITMRVTVYTKHRLLHSLY